MHQNIKKLSYKNGNIYQGPIKSPNIRQGQGKLTQPNGEYYEGEFCNDKKQGIGK